MILKSSYRGPSSLFVLHVHSPILSLASPLWRRMIADTTASRSTRCGEPTEGRRELILPEPYEVLKLLLLSIYPNTSPPALSLKAIVPVLEACLKYRLSGSLKLFRGMLLTTSFLLKDPIRVFSIAARFGLDDEAREASGYCLKADIIDNSQPGIELREIPASVYCRLIELRKDTLSKVMSKVEELIPGPCHERCLGKTYAQHFTALKDKINLSLQKDPIAVDFLDIKSILPDYRPIAYQCSPCGKQMQSGLIELRSYIENLPHSLELVTPFFNTSSLPISYVSQRTSSSQSPLHKPSPPFIFEFGHSICDITLHPCDYNVRGSIKAHKSVLSASSGLFRDMFSLPQGDSETTNSLDINMDEDYEMLHALLKFMYPNMQPKVTDLSTLDRLLSLAGKYDVPLMVNRLKVRLFNFAKNSPLRVFALACKYEFQDIAEAAASYSLAVHIYDAPLPQELKDISAFAYVSLLHLHRMRGQEAALLVQRMNTSIPCDECGSAPDWCPVFRNLASEEVRQRPNSDVIFDIKFLSQVIENTSCGGCGSSLFKSRECLDELQEEIDALPMTLGDVV
jgi:hypothetical protein